MWFHGTRLRALSEHDTDGMRTELAQLRTNTTSVRLTRAEAADLPALVALLADDPVSAGRETADGDLSPYRRAFEAIDANRDQLLVSALDGDRLVGTFQLTIIPGLTRGGSTRAQIEAVRVHRDYRSAGLGGAMMRWAIAEAGRRGCALVQLTSDKSRRDAHRFYERLGFVASHEGYKLQL
jgi:GNAT superfamily N-acetyltransferase